MHILLMRSYTAGFRKFSREFAVCDWPLTYREVVPKTPFSSSICLLPAWPAQAAFALREAGEGCCQDPPLPRKQPVHPETSNPELL